ncbi:NADH:quinone reductase (non-electrogenic) [Marchantia polymorpha subsp. ruderalis]|nr:hypothetical protein MARPO_0035s0102 [Marchantia polymorpha]BBN13407.1 hypothetical protein Mp_6g03220 [Marchantia polymorpha subsp. ruderalis]|eukprot:PTQ41328.1 hypothetical protein MARPO_0035s0102 [Marchantia polymorpha]
MRRFALTSLRRNARCEEVERILVAAPNHVPTPVRPVSSYFSFPVYKPYLQRTSSFREFHSSKFSSQIALEEPQQHKASEVERIKNALPATREGQKARVVVLGAGWAACRLMKDLNTKLYDVVCISPRNHMVFTPLLASTCVGTLEFRSVAEPVRTIQPATAKEKDSYFFLAHCTHIDTENRQVICKALGKDETAFMKASGDFVVAYDKLIIASGAEALTLGIAGVPKHAIFLREVKDAKAIRSKLLLNLALAEIPGVSEEEKTRILNCVVVGGGPTGVEFSGELSDFIKRDVLQKFSHMRGKVHVTLIEANEILSSFDLRLRQYATSHLEKAGVRLVKGMVKDVDAEKITLSDGSEVPYGLLVWSTGVGPSAFVKSLPFQKSPGGRIGVDEYLRVPGYEDVYAIGDCAGYLESTGKQVLPALAQVAEREGKYLARVLNEFGKHGAGRAGAKLDSAAIKPFIYRHLGSMASVGSYKALVDLRDTKKASKGVSMAGFLSWIVWRSAYLTRVVSWRNRIYVALNWTTTLIFGRDITRI